MPNSLLERDVKKLSIFIFFISVFCVQQSYTQSFTRPDLYQNNLQNQGIKKANSQEISKLQVNNLTPFSVDLSWDTNESTQTVLMYGTTTDYEIDTIFVNESKSFHDLHLSNLKPATIYHIKVGSVNGSDTLYSPDQIVMTASHPSSTGEMRVYFSQSVDTIYARHKKASKENILLQFIRRVNSAKYSIDICFYNITLDEVAQVLIGAYKRGVRVRLIYDDDYEGNSAIQLIKNAGVPNINDSFGSNSGSKYMHNKFMIIDHIDTTSFSDDWVWTGSYNLSYSATYENAENVIEIQDQALAACYTIEFNEMWGSDTEVPNAANSRFGSKKTNNTPHTFNINGIEVQQYMSPSDNGLQYLLREIGQSKSSLYFGILSFTQHEIANAMYQKWNAIPNFKVKGVFEEDNVYGGQYYNLNGTGSYPWNPPADVHLDNERRLLHHKYLIIDSDDGPGDPVLITGSYNWSYSAENSNDENFLIIKDSTIANLYLQEFAERYHKAGGTDFLTYTAVESKHDQILPHTTYLSQNYPNPFNQLTTFQINLSSPSILSVDIYNIKGQIVKSFDIGYQRPGQYKISWDGTDYSGKSIAGGIYFYRLKLDDGKENFQIKKMIYLP